MLGLTSEESVVSDDCFKELKNNEQKNVTSQNKFDKRTENMSSNNHYGHQTSNLEILGSSPTLSWPLTQIVAW